ncbi:multicopper oxidase family protein [Prosthecomicrobium sp. N25]|uniref:multicopper oxidase family protein n=1 Tax=Prosthecomicrobium sp. N25 TaxID=3129254 RepID=UPI003077FB95
MLGSSAQSRPAWTAAPLPPAVEPGAPATHDWTFEAAEREVALLGADAPPVKAWTYTPEPFPVLRVRRGDRVRARLVNRLSEHVSIHWHGLRIPNAMDGVQYLTQPPVQPGGSFTYAFSPPDPGTFFFHPHCNESGQVGRGLAGILVVEGDERRKPDRELVVAVKDWRLGPDGRFLDFVTPEGASRAGTFGTLRSANGRRSVTETVPAGADLRVRLLNLDATRVMEIGIDGAEAAIIAVDGHAIAPVALDERGLETWRMGPAMRLDLLVRTPKPGGTARISDYFSAEPWTVATLTATGKPVRKAPLDPAILTRPVFPEPDLAGAERLAYTFTAASDSIASYAEAIGEDSVRRVLMDSLCVRDRTFWAINKLSWPNAADPRLPPPMAMLAAGRTYRLELVNATPHPHPIHLHGHVFRVLTSSIGGKPVYAADTVLLSPKERVEIAFVAAPGDWMFHCHILEHLETGMMGYFRVV